MIIITNLNKKRSIICSAAAFVNLLLFFVKLYIAVSSNSISIYVDSLNSLSDTLVCIIGVVGFCIAAMPANEKYPFGFGKAEELVNLMLSVVILFTGLAFVYTSLQRLMYPVPVWFSVKYAVVIGCTAVVKLFMAFFFRRSEKKYSSEVIKNLGVDSILDFFVSLCIVISFTLTNYIGYSVDAITGIVTSLVIIVCGAKSLFASCKILTGRRNDKRCEKALAVLSSNKSVTKIESLECHVYGEVTVYNAKIKCNCSSVTQVSDLCHELQRQFKDELNSEIYFNYGG